MGQVTIKTAKKLASGGGVSDSWYPLQPSKSGKAASGALKIKLRVVKKALTVANLQKKKSGFIVPELDLFQMIRNHDAKAVDIYLDTASEDDVNRPEEKTGNTPLHAACLESKNLPEDVFWSLLRVCALSLVFEYVFNLLAYDFPSGGTLRSFSFLGFKKRSFPRFASMYPTQTKIPRYTTFVRSGKIPILV
jgi:hypothetical protein